MSALYALRRGWETGEAQWFWKLGRWDVGAGVFKGFGLGFTVQPGRVGCDARPLQRRWSQRGAGVSYLWPIAIPLLAAIPALFMLRFGKN